MEVRDGRVRLLGTDTLAGSTLTMAEAVRRYARFTGAGIVELAAVASTNAAVYWERTIASAGSALATRLTSWSLTSTWPASGS